MVQMRRYTMSADYEDLLSGLTNGMIWNRGNQDDFNAWENLGNSDWGWNGLFNYFRKVGFFLLTEVVEITMIVGKLHPHILPRNSTGVPGKRRLESARL